MTVTTGAILQPFRRSVVLAYHGVGDATDAEDGDRLVLQPRRLEQQLRLLLRLGYRFVTAADLLDGSPDAPPEPGVAVLTFDDGWRDAVDMVVPLLRRLGVRASFYVCAGWFGGHHPLVPGHAGALLDIADVAALAAAGMEVGSHAVTHRDLRLLGDDELAEELDVSRTRIESVVGAPCRTFAYPYGLHDARVRDAVRSAGYELALGWGPGRWDRYAVPRLPAPPRHGAGRLALKLAGIRRRAA